MWAFASRPHAWITVHLISHQSWHGEAIFVCHVGQGRCVEYLSVRPYAVSPSDKTSCESGRAVELPSRPHAMPVFGCRLPRLATSLSPRGSFIPLLIHYSTTHYPHQLHSVEEKPRGEGDGGGERVDRIRGRWWGSPDRSVVAGEPQIEGKAPSRAHIFLPVILHPLPLCSISAWVSSRFRPIRGAPASPSAVESRACHLGRHCAVSSPLRWQSCRCGPNPSPSPSVAKYVFCLAIERAIFLDVSYDLPRNAMAISVGSILFVKFQGMIVANEPQI